MSFCDRPASAKTEVLIEISINTLDGLKSWFVSADSLEFIKLGLKLVSSVYEIQ